MAVEFLPFIEAALEKKARAIVCAAGFPPRLVMNSDQKKGLWSIDHTEALSPDDIIALMKSITPDRRQQQLQEEGWCEFSTQVGELARVRVFVNRENGEGFHETGLRITATCFAPQAPSQDQAVSEVKNDKEVLARISDVVGWFKASQTGLVIVCGPSVADQTRIMSAIALEAAKVNEYGNVVYLEQLPIFSLNNETSPVSQITVGSSVPSMDLAIRNCASLFPDLVCIDPLIGTGLSCGLDNLLNAIELAKRSLVVASVPYTAAGKFQEVQKFLLRLLPTDQMRALIEPDIEAVLREPICMR